MLKAKRNICKYCHSAKTAEYRKNNRESVKLGLKDWYAKKGRADRLLKIYGLTPEQYAAMLDNQSGLCRLCDKILTPGGSMKHDSACVDHDHKTGKIRGILCHSCNIGLGAFRDNPAVLQAAINYLKAV